MLSKISNIRIPEPTASDIYLDNNVTGTGTGTILDPYGPFSEIPWGTLPLGGLPTTIHLKRGVTWDEQLTVGDTGTAAAPITIQPYSTGADPVIDGGGVRTYGIHIDGKSYITVDNIAVTNTTSNNIRVDDPSSNIAITNCDLSSTASGSAMSIIGASGIEITNITITDNTITGAFARGIQLNYVESSTISRNISHTNTNAGIFLHHSGNNTIEDNYLYENVDSGIHLELSGCTDNLIQRNKFDGNNTGGDGNIGDLYLNQAGTNNVLYLNVLLNPSRAGININTTTALGNLVYNNTIFRSLIAGGYRVTGTSGNATFKNNIIYGDSSNVHIFFSVGSTTNQVLNYNFYYNTANDVYQWSGSAYNFAAYKLNNGGQEINSRSGTPPLFTSVGTDDVTLQTASTCRTGAEVISGYTDRLDPASSWPNNVSTKSDSAIVGAYGYTP